MSQTDSINDGAIQSLLKRATQLWWRCEAALERIERRAQVIMEKADEKVGTGIARTDTNCTDNSVEASESAHVNINRIEISERTMALVALLIAALALGMVLMLPGQQAARVDMAVDRAAKAEREARVMQERWNDLKVELAKRGIPTSDH